MPSRSSGLTRTSEESSTILDAQGELDNTLVIFTSDNGMAFPRAKANLYDYGIHMPLAVRWAGEGRPGRTVDDIVQFVDLTATIIDLAGVRHPGGVSALAGRSVRNILESEADGLVGPRQNARLLGTGAPLLVSLEQSHLSAAFHEDAAASVHSELQAAALAGWSAPEAPAPEANWKKCMRPTTTSTPAPP